MTKQTMVSRVQIFETIVSEVFTWFEENKVGPQTLIAVELEISLDQARRALLKLEELGHIICQRRPGRPTMWVAIDD